LPVCVFQDKWVLAFSLLCTP